MVLDIQTVHHILQNTAVQNVNKPFVYITDWTSTLILNLCLIPINDKLSWCTMYDKKLGGDYMEHFQPRGWTQPCLPGWNFSPVCNTKLYQNQTRDYMTKFSTQGCVQPRDWTFNPASANRVEISTPGL